LSEKMRKVLFLMFLLLLMGLGAASVKAQVRIGGNGAPQGAAVLDLNADNTATPTANKGALALPRVSLASTTAQLNGTAPITGMLVYNTNATLGMGVYYWDGSNWVNLHSTSASSFDSILGLTSAAPGAVLRWNGHQWQVTRPDTVVMFRVSCTACPALAVAGVVGVTLPFPAGCSYANSWYGGTTYSQFYTWGAEPCCSYADVIKVAATSAVPSSDWYCLRRN